MYIGEQLSELSDRRLTWAAQLGVQHVAVHTPAVADAQAGDGTWSAAAIKRVQERLAAFGMALDVLALDVEALWPMLLRRDPAAGALIERLQQNIRVAGEAGVPCLKYRMQPIGIPRTGRTPGRGGARYSHFDVRQWTDHSLTEAGQLSPEDCWDAMTSLLEGIVPVAEAAGVRLACHPNDPALPHDTGLRGIHHILGSVEGLKRFVDIAPSTYHGLNFCQGTVAEMCVDPATEVLEAIRYFGERQKIFMVHFRNIKGGYLRFDEVYPDNGDVDMLQAMRVYQEVGYQGMFCPDHVPQSDVDPGGERQFAYCLGYIRALIQAT
ncbi:MAG: mannonate dehydratase [Chloroflexota bacterium]